MATHLQNKISTDVATDISSFESLSFAGLLSVQDLQPKSPPTYSTIQIKKQDQQFEFSHTTSDSAANNSNKNCSADISMSNGQVQLQMFLCQSKQVNHKPGSKGATRSNNKRLIDGNSNSMNFTNTPNPKERNQAKKKHTASNLSFGQKIFQSFVSPCRECHAHKPSTKAHIVPETIKLH